MAKSTSTKSTGGRSGGCARKAVERMELATAISAHLGPRSAASRRNCACR